MMIGSYFDPDSTPQNSSNVSYRVHVKVQS
jgi:hypothetical protein